MADALEAMIREGEHQQQDFKYRVDDARKIARSLVAFANTDGGRLLVGVKDNGKVAGVYSEEELHVIETAALLYTQPEVPFTTRLWHRGGKQVLEVIIPVSEVRPHRAKTDDNRWMAYLRRADQNLLANRVLLKVMAAKVAPKGAHITYTEPEQQLFAYLRESGSISFSRFCRLANIKRGEAEAILVKLICWEVLAADLTADGCRYRLADQFGSTVD